MTATEGSGNGGVDRRGAEREFAIELLAGGASYGEVAEELGRTPRTITRWMSDPGFVVRCRSVVRSV